MLIVKALNITPNAEDEEGKSSYSVIVSINERPIWVGTVEGHVRASGAGDLLKLIGECMNEHGRQRERDAEFISKSTQHSLS